jgi:hypothetical protein
MKPARQPDKASVGGSLRACVIVIGGLLAGCGTVNRAKFLLPAPWFGLEAIAPSVFVEKEMPIDQRENFLQAVSLAKERTENLFGSLAAAPEIYACATEACFRGFGGSTNRANSFGRYKILLSPRALTALMISHEWSHAELYARVGGSSAMRRVPKWFDDGLAVMISEEPTHSEEIWEETVRSDIALPDLSALETSDQRIRGVKKYRDPGLNPRNLAVVYSVAGHEVRGWYRRVGQAGLLQLIANLREGKDFYRSYRCILERAATGLEPRLAEC